MTSNLGAEALVSDVSEEGVVSASARRNVMEAVRQAFSPEFINRIDEMVRNADHTFVYKVIELQGVR